MDGWRRLLSGAEANMNEHPILIVSGTNRPASNTLRIARAVAGLYEQAGVRHALFSLTDLPCELFSPEVYAKKPPAFVAVQEQVISAAGLHVVLPEYNGSFPGVLKYFIDLLKFPESFDRKAVAFVGVTNGQWGGLRAVEQMQMVFSYRNAHVYPERVFVSDVQKKLDSEGVITDSALADRLTKQTRGFAEFSGLFVKHGYNSTGASGT